MTAASNSRVAVVVAMISGLAPAAREQLARALHGELHPPEAAGDRRLRELLPLARLLDEQAGRDGITPAYGGPGARKPSLTHAGTFPVVAQTDYDRQRPTDAPSGAALAKRFGGWVLACRAVFGLQADGRYRGVGKPWANGTRGKPRKTAFTRDEALHAIRACALAYGRRPTSVLYIDWSGRRRHHARISAAPDPRLPAYPHYHRRYGGWRRALELAAISDLELAEARAARGEPGPEVPEDRTPAGRLRAADVARLAAAQVGPDDVTRMLKRGFGDLEVSRAAALARILDGSLAWLGGWQPNRGIPPAPGGVLDSDEVRRLRRERAVPEQAILDQLGLTTNDWRRVLDGRDELRSTSSATSPACSASTPTSCWWPSRSPRSTRRERPAREAVELTERGDSSGRLRRPSRPAGRGARSCRSRACCLTLAHRRAAQPGVVWPAHPGPAVSEPRHWQSDPRHQDRASRVRKARYEMTVFALQVTPRRRWIRRLRLRWRLKRLQADGRDRNR